MIITAKYLKENPGHIFVFGDNTIRQGYGGAAALRDHINSYGFITKKYPADEDSDFYTPEEYEPVYKEEIEKLKSWMNYCPNKKFMISQLGAGLANRFGIWEKVIEPNIKKDLQNFKNVIYLF